MTNPLSLSIHCLMSKHYPSHNDSGEPAYMPGTNMMTSIVVYVHPDNLEILKKAVAHFGGRILDAFNIDNGNEKQ